MGAPKDIAALRARYERDELRGEELVQALMVLFGYDRMNAELIDSGDFLPKTRKGITERM